MWHRVPNLDPDLLAAYSESSLEAAQLQGAPKKPDGALPVLDSCARGGNVVS